MNELYKRMLEKAINPSDINEHILTLFGYAFGCDHITEMGTREITSTWAFLAAKPKKLVGIDIYVSPNLPEAQKLSKENEINFQFLNQSTLQPGFEIEQTDFLFIDTAHTYAQLSQELLRHAHKVNKYIAFHDTTSYGFVNEPPYAANLELEQSVNSNDPQGLVPAITEFVNSNHEWVIDRSYNNNNGLTIIAKL